MNNSQRQVKEVTMTGKTVLITGATGGIGKETATALASQGATVVVTGRNKARGMQVVEEIQTKSGHQNIHLLTANLLEQADVRQLADNFKERFDRLDVLINNVGGLYEERQLTQDNIEATFAINTLTPFLLTHLLLDILKSDGGARVVNLTGGMPGTRLNLDNLQGETRFIPLPHYSHAKLAMSALSYEMAQRLKGSNVTLNVTYPGTADTAMTQSLSTKMLPPLMRLMLPLMKRASKSAPERAARSSVYLASSPEVEGINASYFNTNAKQTKWQQDILDAAKRRALWDTALKLTHL
ncbi:MAG: SDR family NAD(P)-dependent oxidoreductase [Deinococcota bacterium]